MKPNDDEEENLLKKEEKPLKENEKERVFGLDLIRVIITYLIVIGHIALDYTLKEPNQILNLIFYPLVLGIFPVFFMLSGYFLLPLKVPLLEFLKKRIIRLIIPYIFYNIIYGIFYLAIKEISTKKFFINIALSFVTTIEQYGMDFWFVFAVLGIYFAMPLFSTFVKNSDLKCWIYFLILFGISSCVSYLHFAFQYVWGERDGDLYSREMLIFFGGNISFALVGTFVKICLKEKKLYIIGIVFFLLGLTGNFLNFYFKPDINANFDNLCTVVESTGFLFLFKDIDVKNETARKIVADISMRTYGIYLNQFIFIKVLNDYLGFRKFNVYWATPVGGTIVFVVSYGLLKILSYIPYMTYLTG